MKPRIDSIRYYSGPVRKKPKAGDERFLKGRGVTQIRQQVIVNDPMLGRGYQVSNGRPVWEWVDKGSARDRTSEAWRQAQERAQ